MNKIYCLLIAYIFAFIAMVFALLCIYAIAKLNLFLIVILGGFSALFTRGSIKMYKEYDEDDDYFSNMV